MLVKLVNDIKSIQDVEKFRADADAGDPLAQTVMGICYATGKLRSETVDEGHARAVKYYLSAAEQGYAGAQAMLGICYLQGRGVPKDDSQAIMWLELAVAQEDPSGCVNLGQCYQVGRGVALDLDKAVQCYAMAAAKGVKHVKAFLAMIIVRAHHQKAYDLAFELCAEAEIENKDFQNTVDLLVQFALTGHEKSKEFLLCLAKIRAEIQMPMAISYAKENQYQESVEFLKLAALNGNPEAQLLLGIFYMRGQYVEKDPIKAQQYYLEAVNQGNANAQCLLGMLLIRHDGNYPLGVKYLREAANQGQTTAKKVIKHLNLSSFEENNRAQRDQQDQAFFVNNPNFKLGLAYQELQDFVMAEFHFQVAIEEENTVEALNQLCALYSLESQESISKAEKSPDAIFEIEDSETEDDSNSFCEAKPEIEKKKKDSDEPSADEISSRKKEDEKYNDSDSDSEEPSGDEISSMEAKLALASYNRLWAQPAIQNQTPQLEKVSNPISDPKPTK